MGILNKFKKSSHRDTAIRNFCIQTVRFKKFLENARALLDLFEDGRRKRRDEQSASEEELYEQIGRLKMEVEWLKKKSAELG